MEEQVKKIHKRILIFFPRNYENTLSFKQFAKHVPDIDTRGLFKFHKECLLAGTEGHYIGLYILLELQVINERQRGIFNY